MPSVTDVKCMGKNMYCTLSMSWVDLISLQHSLKPCQSREKMAAKSSNHLDFPLCLLSHSTSELRSSNYHRLVTFLPLMRMESEKLFYNFIRCKEAVIFVPVTSRLHPTPREACFNYFSLNWTCLFRLLIPWNLLKTQIPPRLKIL